MWAQFFPSPADGIPIEPGSYQYVWDTRRQPALRQIAHSKPAGFAGLQQFTGGACLLNHLRFLKFRRISLRVIAVNRMKQIPLRTLGTALRARQMRNTEATYLHPAPSMISSARVLLSSIGVNP